MDVIELLVADVQASDPMSANDFSFDDPTGNTQAAAMLGPTSRDLHADAAPAQGATMGHGVIAAVALYQVWAAHGPATTAANRRNPLH